MASTRPQEVTRRSCSPGSKSTNSGWVIPQTTAKTVEACVSVGKMPANPWARYLRIPGQIG